MATDAEVREAIEKMEQEEGIEYKLSVEPFNRPDSVVEATDEEVRETIESAERTDDRSDVSDSWSWV